VRVLHILAERGVSGGEDQLLHVIRALQAAGHENRFVLQPGAAFKPLAEATGAVLAEIRMRNSLDVPAAFRIRRAMGRAEADLIHLADSRAHKLGMLARVGCAAGPPLVVTRRMDYPLRPTWSTRRLYGPRIAAVVAISAAVAAELAKAGVPPERIHLIHDGAGTEVAEGLAARRPEARRALGYDDEQLVVLAAASLRPRKGQIHLVQAFRTITSSRPEARLLLAGEGSDRAALEAAVREYGLASHVHLPGRLPIEQALAAADIACVPSLLEGLSVFSLEAQVCERPVVASRVGGLVEAIADGETGLLVRPGDPAALAAALERLLADPALRARMGAAGRARVLERFTASHMAQRTVALYETLAADS
jgi:glycosyltransferase involved in cell wall biosynthesis